MRADAEGNMPALLHYCSAPGSDPAFTYVVVLIPQHSELFATLLATKPEMNCAQHAHMITLLDGKLKYAVLYVFLRL